jgi:hypothetical protein
MQIVVDTTKDSADHIHRAALLLIALTAPYLSAAPDNTAAAAPAVPPAPDFVPSDDKAPDSFEKGATAEAERAAAVFGAAPLAPLPVPPPPSVDTATGPAGFTAPPNLAPAAAAPLADVDSAGVPHNPAIHAANKAKKQDGTWKAKKGGTAPAVPIPPPPSIVPAPAPQPVPAPPVPLSPVPLPPSAPDAGQPASVPSGSPSFREVMQKMNAGISANKITKADTDAMLVTVGLKADELAPLVMPANAQLLAAFNQLLDAKLAA